MATISSLGVGSGLDLNSIVSSLMAVEQQPLTALKTKEASAQSRISALGNLKSTLSSLQSSAEALIPGIGQTATDKFASFKSTVADTTVATATAKAGAVNGNYSLEVTSLAQSHRLTTPASTDSAGSALLAAALATGGSLTIDLGSLSGGVFTADSAQRLTVAVPAGGTLETVRDAINAASTDGRVSATIINGTDGKQLVLSSMKTGTENVLKLSGINGLNFDPAGSGTGTLSQDPSKGGQAASDALFKLNGIAASSSGNVITDVLDGVTLTLLKPTTSATSLTVSKDSTTNLTTAINGFIAAYNLASASMKSLGAYNPTTDVAGALQGDATLRGAQNQMRSLLQTSTGGNSVYRSLSSIGVELQKDGTLKLDSAKLNNAVAADYGGVATLVEKVGKTFKTGLDNVVGSSGSITAATDSTNRMIKEIQKRRESLTTRLEQVEARYTKQFAALDKLVANLNQTSSWLTAQLSNLPGSSSSSKR